MFFHSSQTKQKFCCDLGNSFLKTCYSGEESVSEGLSRSAWPVGLCVEECLDYIQCGWYHSLGLGPVLQKEAREQSFPMDAISCCRLLQLDFPAVTDNNLEVNPSLLSCAVSAYYHNDSRENWTHWSIRKTVLYWEGHTLVTSTNTQGILNTCILVPQGHSTLSNCDNGSFPFISIFLSHLPSFYLFLFPPTPQFYGRFIWFGKKTPCGYRYILNNFELNIKFKLVIAYW